MVTYCNIRPWTTGDTVKRLQSRLRELGIYRGRIDGAYGKYTIEAVKIYQSRNGLVMDGYAGPVTSRMLGLTCPSPTPTPPTPTPSPTPPTPTEPDTVHLHVPIDRQDDKCRCCPSSWYMILQYWKVPTTEQELANLLGTSDTKNTGASCTGTPPQRIPQMVMAVNKKYNRTFQVANYYLHEVGGLNALKERYIKNGTPIVLHVNPRAFTWTDWSGGHYVAMDGYKPGLSQINDPYWVNGSQVWERDANVIAAVQARESAGQKPKGVWIIWE